MKNYIKLYLVFISVLFGCHSSNELLDSQSRYIVIVNIDTLDRSELGQLLRKLSDKKPKVVGLDIFLNDTNDIYADSLLSNSIQLFNKIVLAQESNKEYIYSPSNIFISNSNIMKGHSAIIVDSDSIAKWWVPYISMDKEFSYHFSYVVAALFAPKIQSNSIYSLSRIGINESLSIKYTRSKGKFLIVNHHEIDEFDEKIFENKIVLLGAIDDSEKMYKTPMASYVEKDRSGRDTNEVVILANIISELIHEYYPDE